MITSNIMFKEMTSRENLVSASIFPADGSRDVVLYEVSVVTFPAYAETSVSARKQDVAEIHKRKLDAWKISTRARLKGEKNGTESTDAEA